MTRHRQLKTAPKDGRRILLIARENTGWGFGRCSSLLGCWQPLTESWGYCRHYLDKTWEETADGTWVSTDGAVKILGWSDPNAPADQDDDQEDW